MGDAGDKTYEDDRRNDDQSDDPSGIGPRICSCLYTYTIGSCLYFKKKDADQVEEIELKSFTPIDQKHEKDAAMEEGVNVNNEWRRKNISKEDCKIKKRIQYHFKDHIKRWMDSDRRRFPWKLILHFLLVALVTTQVTGFVWYTYTYT